jgi:hypothetical protein
MAATKRSHRRKLTPDNSDGHFLGPRELFFQCTVMPTFDFGKRHPSSKVTERIHAGRSRTREWWTLFVSKMDSMTNLP